MKKIVIGVSGATGSPYALKLLQFLQDFDVEVTLIISKWARYTIDLETQYSFEDFTSLAHKVYSHTDQAAEVSSGSSLPDAMIIVPCSMKTLASIRIGLADNLISRTADVILKEQKKLILCVRETPLNSIHLDNMLYLSKLGVSICPPMPAFYNMPQSIDDIVSHNTVRILDQLGLHHVSAKRWKSHN